MALLVCDPTTERRELDCRDQTNYSVCRAVHPTPSFGTHTVGENAVDEYVYAHDLDAQSIRMKFGACIDALRWILPAAMSSNTHSLYCRIFFSLSLGVTSSPKNTGNGQNE